MAIAVFTYLSKNISRKLNNCHNFNEVSDLCVENINEFHFRIKTIHCSCHVTLKVVR